PPGNHRGAGGVGAYRVGRPYQAEQAHQYGMVSGGKGAVSNHASARIVKSAGRFADELTRKHTADEAGCDPCVTGARGARDPSLRQARCLDRRDERIDARAMGYNWRMKATSAAFSRGVSCTPRTRLKNSTVSSNVKRRPSCMYGGESLIPRRVKVLIGPSAWIH